MAALEDLGLTQYEAQCFVALTRLPKGSAKEVSQVADVPRSRVYDAVERLHQRGLVDVQESEPRQYRAVSVEQALDRLRRDYTDRVDTAARLLDDVETAKTTEDKGVWAIAEHDHVSDRMTALIADATAEIHFLIATDRVIEQRTLSGLNAAADRGVDIVVEAATDALVEQLRQSAPDATVLLSPDLRDAAQVGRKWPGQLLLVDQRAVLASGVEETDLPDVVRETAAWSSGIDHGFATWIRELLTDRLDAAGAGGAGDDAGAVGDAGDANGSTEG